MRARSSPRVLRRLAQISLALAFAGSVVGACYSKEDETAQPSTDGRDGGGGDATIDTVVDRSSTNDARLEATSDGTTDAIEAGDAGDADLDASDASADVTLDGETDGGGDASDAASDASDADANADASDAEAG